MSPPEVLLYVTARTEREVEMAKVNLQLYAQLAAWILMPHSSRPLTAGDLLGVGEEDYWAIKKRIRLTKERFGTG